MTEELRFPGKWWIPGQEANAVGGVLEIDSDGSPTLEVYDKLVDERFIDIIHGHSSGKEITLVDASRRGGKSTFGQAETVVEKIGTKLAFIGFHLDSEMDELFSESVVEISCLTEWVGDSGIEFRLLFDDQQKVKQQTLEVIPSEDLTIECEGWEYSIDFLRRIQSQPSASFTWGKEAYFKETVQLRIRTRNPSSWNAFNSVIHSVQNLVTLGVQQGCAIRNRRLGIILDDGKKWPVRLYFANSSEWVDAPVQRHKFLFHFSDLGDDHAAALSTWFSLTESIGLAVDVLFSLDHSSPTYYENELFNIGSAAEGFHGALFPESKQIPSGDHLDIVQRAKEVFADHPNKEFVTRALAFNRPGLKQRFLELATVPDAESVQNLLTEVDIWAKWLKDARNAIGHLNTGELERKIPEDARYRLAYISKALLHLVLIAKMGISGDIQQRAVRDIYGYSAREFGKAVASALN